MLPEHTQNIQNGFLFFLVTGIALLVPAVTFHYFRFGRVEPRRTFVFYAGLLYSLVALALVLMPFPEIGTVCVAPPSPQWTPFQFVFDTWTERGFTSGPLLSWVFNIALFVPLGVLLRKAYGLRRHWVALVGLAVSLAIEIMQVTGNFGIYPCPYRLFDVNDLMANAAGAAIGGLIAPAALIVPKVLPASEARAQLDAVGLPRQIIAYCMDVALSCLAVILVYLLTEFGSGWTVAVVFAVLRIVVPLLTDGYTPAGKRLKFKVRMVDRTPITVGRIVVREGCGPVGALGLVALVVVFGEMGARAIDRLTMAKTFGLPGHEPLLVVAIVGIAVFSLLLFAPAARRDQRAWHDVLAGTRCVLDTPRVEPAGQPLAREAVSEESSHAG